LKSIVSNPTVALIGYTAAALTTFCFVPQLLHTFKTKSVNDLHVGTLILFDLGLVLWLVYGIYLHSWPMILANTVTLGFQLALLRLKFRYGTSAHHKGTESQRK
jgi:MtN3 and saliva related transmembrane protein